MTKKTVVFKAPKSRALFYILSVTWGFPMVILGSIVAVALLVAGIKPKRFGWMMCFELEVGFGVSLGLVMISPKGDSKSDFELRAHEHGHALQNAYLGFLFPILVAIPSFVRYWYREFRCAIKKPCTTDYDAIWFEGTATISGLAFMKNLKGETV